MKKTATKTRRKLSPLRRVKKTLTKRAKPKSKKITPRLLTAEGLNRRSL